jgi:hypothetical protein
MVKLQSTFLKLSVVNEQRKHITVPITNKDALINSSIRITFLRAEAKPSTSYQQV